MRGVLGRRVLGRPVLERRALEGWLFGSLLLVLGAATANAAVTDDNFRLRTGADLVALCGVAADDPLVVQAIHLCQGFGAGTWQTLVAIGSHEKVTDFFCPPDPPPSRNDAVARFVAWANLAENASHLSESPAALVGRYLITKYSCPTPATTGGAQ